jgi:hypothetical protein
MAGACKGSWREKARGGRFHRGFKVPQTSETFPSCNLESHLRGIHEVALNHIWRRASEGTCGDIHIGMLLAHTGGEVRPIYMVHRSRNTAKNVASSFPQQRWKTGAKLSGGLENKGRFHLQTQAKVLGRGERKIPERDLLQESWVAKDSKRGWDFIGSQDLGLILMGSVDSFSWKKPASLTRGLGQVLLHHTVDQQ